MENKRIVMVGAGMVGKTVSVTESKVEVIIVDDPFKKTPKSIRTYPAPTMINLAPKGKPNRRERREKERKNRKKK